MLPYAGAFLAGVLLLQFFATLPSYWLLVLLVPLIMLCYYLRPTVAKIVAMFASGFALTLCDAKHKAVTIPTAWESAPQHISGQVASLPQFSQHLVTFLFKMDQPVATLLRLSWPQPPVKQLLVGDSWSFTVRLKKIHGTLNPGGIDYAALDFAQGVRATAYVVPGSVAKHLSAAGVSYWPALLRQTIKQRLQQLLPQQPMLPWLLALLIGDRQDFSPEVWAVLEKTGTNHLMAIAGLHLGFMAALAYKVSAWCWRLWPRLLLLLPAPLFGASSALLLTSLYACLAGFALPSQRALIMLAMYLVATLSQRVISLWQAFASALLVVLCCNPLSVLTASFWLSFATLALLILARSSVLERRSRWQHWYQHQVLLAIGLLPVNIWFFGQYSLLSLLANSIAIPWVGWLILPLCLVGLALLWPLPLLAKLFFYLASVNLHYLWCLLSWLATWPGAVWHQAVTGDGFYHAHYGYLLAALVAVGCYLLPAGFPGRLLGMLCLLPLISTKMPSPAYAELKFTLLDVGQGLAAVVQTQHHVLVFDTGPRFSAKADMGAVVVLPFLRNQGISTIDMLVISHGDNDHAGGAAAILQQLPVTEIRTSVPELFSGQHATYCQAGTVWEWDGVVLEFLYPDSRHLHLGNNSSCVVHISNKAASILLPADIEAPAQRYLVATAGKQLASTIIVVPHHGSNTSGLREFINYVHPQYALYAIGYRNRYHFPHPTIVDLYRQWGASQYATVSGGALQFYFSNTALLGPSLYRQQIKRYWHN
jgi:competence protein ComEC